MVWLVCGACGSQFSVPAIAPGATSVSCPHCSAKVLAVLVKAPTRISHPMLDFTWSAGKTVALIVAAVFIAGVAVMVIAGVRL
jgi:DNA-directed RNA polymerase subunit RPC12/RpoP